MGALSYVRVIDGMKPQSKIKLSHYHMVEFCEFQNQTKTDRDNYDSAPLHHDIQL